MTVVMIEYFSLFVFLFAYLLTRNIYTTISITLALSWISVLILFMVRGGIKYTTWVSLFILTVFGGMSLLFHNPIYIMLKPTIVYFTFALLILLDLCFSKHFIKHFLLDKIIILSQYKYKRIAIIWLCYFIILGIVNLIIVKYFSVLYWIILKLVSSLLLSALFILFTIYYIQYKK